LGRLAGGRNAAVPEPTAQAAARPLILEGVLLRDKPCAVKLLVGGLCVELAVEDLDAVEELHLDSPPGFGIPVRVRLRRPAQLLEIGPAWPYVGFLKGGLRTFASSSRPWSPMPLRAGHYRELEQEFLRRHGVESEADPS